MTNDALKPGNTALVTGGAAGIGLAAARRFAGCGMAVVIADVRDELFEAAKSDLLAAGARDVLARRVDVADRPAVEMLEREVVDRFGGLDVLMCNAGIQPGSDILDTGGTWERVIAVNLWGIVSTCQVFIPGMVTRGRPGLVVNTGSKQGITTPPGDPAYNVSKAAVKAFTEALSHEMRSEGHQIAVHLLIPGFVFTDLTRHGRTNKPAAAWTPEQTADFMMERLARGDFYILCPDNDVPRSLDEKRMAWAIGDIIENRPALSRWHQDFAEQFEAFVKQT